ncbi:MAG: MarR family winged helix-turn-helix transcriptional regulator [Desulfatibacillaceae bacterium]
MVIEGQQQLDELLYQALRAVYRLERAKVEAHGLDYGAIYLLQYLRRHSPAAVTMAAREMRVPVSTASRLAGRLEKRGLVRRCQDPRDRRRTLVHLEPDGEQVVREVERHSFEIISANLEKLRPDALNRLVEAARLLPEVLEADDEDVG